MRRHLSLCILAMCVGLSAYSQSCDASCDSLGRVLQDVVVSSSMADKVVTSAAPMRVVDEQWMLRGGVTDVSDALHRMPGVTLRDYGGAGGLKTVSVRGFGAGHTGVFFDGVPLSDVQSGQIDLSRYSVDNVNVVSMVVGDNDDVFIPARVAASSATVNIGSCSHETVERMGVNAKLRVGSFGLCNPFVRVDMPLGEEWGASVVGEFIHADNDYPFRLRNGLLTTTERRNNSRMNSGHAEWNVSGRLGSATDMMAKAYFYNNSRQLPGPVIYYNNVSHEHLDEQNAFAQTKLRSLLTDKLSLQTIAKFNFGTWHYHDENGKYPGGVLEQKYWQREYYVSGALLYAPVSNWLFDYSADYFFNNLNSNLSTDIQPYRHSVLQSATAKYRSSRLTVMARALCSLYMNGASCGEASADYSRLSPSMSVSWQPVESRLLFVRASYKNIFRMPTFNESYFDRIGSADLKPESTDQLNMGLTYTANADGVLRSATFTVDGYLNHVRDMIVAVPYNMFIWNMVNLGKVRVVGVDATAELFFVPKNRHRISITANYSLQRAMPRTSRESSDWMKQVAYIPKHSGNAAISYENPWVNVSLHGTGVSERYTMNSNLPATRISGYAEFGATTWRTFAVKGQTVDVRVDVINLFDKQYYVVARYPMPGRSVKLTLSYKY